MEGQLAKYKHRVIFKGAIPINEIPDYLALTKICIFPSLWEAFGYVALEAMSAGVPIIVSKGSGLSEVVGEGKFGLLINALKPSNIVQSVDELLNNEERCNYLSERGRIRVKDFDKYSKLPDQFISIYKKALAK
jgi:1,4-alpha-glucan branching enzyme